MDLYQLLGVRRNATVADVRRAYQKHARRLHPDLNPGDPVARQRFEEMSRAFEVLSDPQRRAAYYRGEVRAAPGPCVPDVGFAGFDFSAEAQAGGVGFRQIFEGVLTAGRPAPGAPARGEDLEQSAGVTFDEAFHGAARRVHLVRLTACASCHGTGDVAIPPQPCEACGGGGQVRARRGRMIFTRPCRACGSTGVLTHRPCERCAGEGRTMQSEWAEVGIPAGAREGSRIRLPGLGNAGRRGGPAGDFSLVIRLDPHPLYRRQDDDLHCEVPVTMTEAALGAHVEVPTPDGPVVIEMPAGTQTGQRFRLRKRGMTRPDGQGRGDLYVEARVWVPAVRDDESRELLRQFERRHHHDPRRGLGVPAPATVPAPEGKAR
jgi:molecular chaperone DnaJ